MQDRITELRIEGLRTIEQATLPLDGLTVLIGANGSGKSSILEACEILRRAAGPGFQDGFYGFHGGLASLLRTGASKLHLGASMEGSDGPLRYDLWIAQDGTAATIDQETLVAGTPADRVIIKRSRSDAHYFGEPPESAPPPVAALSPMLGSFGQRPPHPAIRRAVSALQGIDVHLPFEVLPTWASRALGRNVPARTAITLQPTDRLALLGQNLANAYSALKNAYGEEHWRETMHLVQLGLGDTVEGVNIQPDPGGGAVALSVKYRGSRGQVPAAVLADGELSYLAFVALFRLSGQQTLLAFDEPETHLHPALLRRVMDFLESLAQSRAVLVATHSDALLDGLTDPARAAVLCDLDEQARSTQLIRPDPEALGRWLTRYRGIGDLRAAGHEASVFAREESS